MSARPQRREVPYKILVIGDIATGKTCIIKRYVHQFFPSYVHATICPDFFLKVLNWDDNTTIRLQLWDIKVSEVFGKMGRVYCRDAVGAFVVFDVTRQATFEAVQKWKKDLDEKVLLPNGKPIPAVLLANKSDLNREGFLDNINQLDQYCKEKGFEGWYETSAKEGTGIEEAARLLVSKVLNWDDNTTIRLQLWDIGGQERFTRLGNLTRAYYKEAAGAFVVFDVTRHDTFETVQMWKKDLDDKVHLPSGKPIPAVLLANKNDLTGKEFLGNINQLDEYCKEKGFEGWFETSVMENTGIEEATRFLVSKDPFER